MAAAIDAAISVIARSQHGNVTREQLLRLGLSTAAIAYRCKTGRLHRVHRGVYAVGRPPTTALEKAAAAVLACGRDAVLSHRSAMTLWGLDSDWQFPAHVSCPHRRRRPGIITHELASLAPRDLRRHFDIPVTSPARTVLDCAPTLTEERLRRIVADSRRQKKLYLSQLADVVARFPNHPGKTRLLPLIRTRGAPTRSEFEDRFPGFCARYGLPQPIINAHVCGYEVDALFEAERVIVELDGWEFHRDREAFEGDRDRDADNLAAGDLATVRITWERFKTRPAREAARLQTILKRPEKASRASGPGARSAPRTSRRGSMARSGAPAARRRARYPPAR